MQDDLKNYPVLFFFCISKSIFCCCGTPSCGPLLALTLLRFLLPSICHLLASNQNVKKAKLKKKKKKNCLKSSGKPPSTCICQVQMAAVSVVPSILDYLCDDVIRTELLPRYLYCTRGCACTLSMVHSWVHFTLLCALYARVCIIHCELYVVQITL